MPTFRIKDLLVNVISPRRGGGAQLCGEDSSGTVPTPLTPVVLVAATQPVLQHLQSVTKKLAAKGADDAAVEAIAEVAADIGQAVAVGAVQGGGVYYPDPNCDGSSLETIPPTITPVVHKNALLLQAPHLDRLQGQLRQALEATEAAAQALVPSGAKEVKQLRTKLTEAADSLQTARGR